MTARKRCWWLTVRECRKILYLKRFPPKLKGSAYKRHIRPAILNGSEGIHGESNVRSTAER